MLDKKHFLNVVAARQTNFQFKWPLFLMENAKLKIGNFPIWIIEYSTCCRFCFVVDYSVHIYIASYICVLKCSWNRIDFMWLLIIIIITISTKYDHDNFVVGNRMQFSPFHSFAMTFINRKETWKLYIVFNQTVYRGSQRRGVGCSLLYFNVIFLSHTIHCSINRCQKLFLFIFLKNFYVKKRTNAPLSADENT